MKKDDSVKTTISVNGGPEVDAKEMFNALKFFPAVFKEARGQTDNLLETHAANILKAYRNNQYELKIGLPISVKGNMTKAAVGTTITYVVEKVTDGLAEMINTEQPGMFPGTEASDA